MLAGGHSHFSARGGDRTDPPASNGTAIRQATSAAELCECDDEWWRWCQARLDFTALLLRIVHSSLPSALGRGQPVCPVEACAIKSSEVFVLTSFASFGIGSATHAFGNRDELDNCCDILGSWRPASFKRSRKNSHINVLMNNYCCQARMIDNTCRIHC